jgi:hypothetical protein
VTNGFGYLSRGNAILQAWKKSYRDPAPLNWVRTAEGTTETQKPEEKENKTKKTLHAVTK